MFPGSPRFQEVLATTPTLTAYTYTKAGRGSEDLGFVIGGPHQRDLIFYAKSAKEKRLWLEDIARSGVHGLCFSQLNTERCPL